MPLVRVLSALFAFAGTITSSTIFLGLRASTTTAFRVAVHRQGNLGCGRQLVRHRGIRSISSSTSNIFRNPVPLAFSQSSIIHLIGHHHHRSSNSINNMAKKRKTSSSSSAAAGASTATGTRRSSRTRASKSEPPVEKPKGVSSSSSKKQKVKQPSSSPSSSSSSSSYKMLMILSPAKTLNLDRDADDLPVDWTEPLSTLRNQRTEIVTAVKGHASSSTKLGSLLKTSAKITATAQAYWKEMSCDGASSGKDSGAVTKPSIMTFDGAAYSGLNVRDSISTNPIQLQYLQDHLRIVDPLYGWLRPMDAIEAYRLEMASKGVFKAEPKVKLEDYWKPGIAACLGTEAEEGDGKTIVVVNLASDEYSAAVDHKLIVKIVFKHGGRTIAVHAKRARGLMVRYASLHKIASVDDLKAFDYEGYSYRPEQSTYDDVGGVEGLLDAFGAKSAAGNESKPSKTKKSKKAQPPTLVFDRPGDWKR